MTKVKRATTLDDRVHAFLLRGKMERVLQYLQEGQHFECLSDADLRCEWTSALKAYSANPGDPRSQKLVDELLAEMAIRLIEPPFGEMKMEVEALMEFASQAHRRLKTELSVIGGQQADTRGMKKRRQTSARN